MAKNLNEQIKEMEMKKREESAPKVEPEAKVSFDSWYHQKKDKFAKCHHKEIILADFKARGLSEEATIEEYDRALGLYGIKL
jgi:hypothetical protein